MNHEAQVHIKAEAQATGKGGVHMSATAGIVVQSSPSFAPPKKLVVDISKVTLTKKV
jgi:hypothetical protein